MTNSATIMLVNSHGDGIHHWDGHGHALAVELHGALRLCNVQTQGGALTSMQVKLEAIYDVRSLCFLMSKPAMEH